MHPGNAAIEPAVTEAICVPIQAEGCIAGEFMPEIPLLDVGMPGVVGCPLALLAPLGHRAT